MRHRMILAALVASFVLLASVPLRADSKTSAEKPFFKGKRIRLIIPFSPGGGTDVYGRVVARHLGKHIAGKPSIIVQNMLGLPAHLCPYRGGLAHDVESL